MGCEETRLDIDPMVKPDIVASLTALGEIWEFDAVYTNHCLEHLYPHEVPLALAEFRRVLKDDGIAVVIVPDVEGLPIGDEVLYVSDDGLPVTAFDMIYGHRRLIARNAHMAHHCGFSARLLGEVMREAGFTLIKLGRQGCYTLFAIGQKRISS